MRQETLMRLKPKLVVQGEILEQVHFLSIHLARFARKAHNNPNPNPLPGLTDIFGLVMILAG
jgi:hypothetical protein